VGDILLEMFRPVKMPAPVYSFYLMTRIRDALKAKYQDREKLIGEVIPDQHGDCIQTVGDCKHAIKLSDTQGNRYRVTIEVLEPGDE
jgi:hypothetical protein